jgi:hypothetical protein
MICKKNCLQAIPMMLMPDAKNKRSLSTLALQSTHFQSFLLASASSWGYSKFFSTKIVSASASIDVDTPHVCVGCRHQFRALAPIPDHQTRILMRAVREKRTREFRDQIIPYVSGTSILVGRAGVSVATYGWPPVDLRAAAIFKRIYGNLRAASEINRRTMFRVKFYR